MSHDQNVIQVPTEMLKLGYPPLLQVCDGSMSWEIGAPGQKTQKTILFVIRVWCIERAELKQMVFDV